MDKVIEHPSDTLFRGEMDGDALGGLDAYRRSLRTEAAAMRKTAYGVPPDAQEIALAERMEKDAIEIDAIYARLEAVYRQAEKDLAAALEKEGADLGVTASLRDGCWSRMAI